LMKSFKRIWQFLKREERAQVQVNDWVMPCKATDSKELERQIMSTNVPKNEREWWAKKRIEELQDFAIWMTGCGYDFTQHDYFCKQHDKLLKA